MRRAGRNVSVVRVFLASPSDVTRERELVCAVTDGINRELGEELGVRIEVVRWETHAAPLAGRPQQAVLDQIDPRECEVFVGVFWLRFGGPTGARDHDGAPIMSGTEEEFLLAYETWRAEGRPEILLYRCTRPPTDVTGIDADQLKRVQGFIDKSRADGVHPGLVRSYGTLDEFERRVRQDLAAVIRRLAPGTAVGGGADLGSSHSSQGLLQLYTPSCNEGRNSRKRNALSESSDIRLVAHSGHSYVAVVGHKFRQELMTRLDDGARFRAVVSNPWSPTGLFIAIGEGGACPGVFSQREAGASAPPDPIALIERTVWYSTKFLDSLSGFSLLRECYGEQVEVRLTRYEMPATILLTERACFFEPYLHVNLQERLQSSLLTFEVEATMDAYLCRHAQAFFDLLWGMSESYEGYAERENEYRDMLRSQFPILRDGSPRTGRAE